MRKLLSHLIAATLGLWLAVLFIPGVHISPLADSTFFGLPITDVWQIYLLLGVVLGLLNFFVKPILNLITLPLRIITLGLSTILVNMALLWAVDAMFRELFTPFFWPLLWTGIIISALTFFISSFVLKEAE